MTARDEPSPTMPSLSIDDLDVIAPGAFAVAVAPLFEGARHFLGRLAMARPFATAEAMFEAAREIAHAMPAAEQIALIDAHARLGAPPASVSALSFVEQGYVDDAVARAAAAAADAATGADVAAVADAARAEAQRARLADELGRLNTAYETRFGFRYCVFVAARPRAELLPEMAAALGADREAEIHRALDAVVDIARDRYATLTAVVSAARQEGPA